MEKGQQLLLPLKKSFRITAGMKNVSLWTNVESSTYKLDSRKQYYISKHVNKKGGWY